MTSKGLIPRWVNLPRVWEPCESISPGSENPVSQSPQCLRTLWVNLPRVWKAGESISPGSENLVSESPQGLRTWWVNLPRVWFPGESISPGAENPMRQSPQGLKPRGINIFELKIFEIWNKIETILFNWSLVRFKWWKYTRGVKSRWIVSLSWAFFGWFSILLSVLGPLHVDQHIFDRLTYQRRYFWKLFVL